MTKQTAAATSQRPIPEPLERRAQHSVSLRPTQWSALDRLGEITRWGRNGAVEEAVELLLTLPPNVIQQLALLRRTQMRAIFRRRFHAAVQEVVQATEVEGGAHTNPWAAYDAALDALGQTATPAPSDQMSEEELAALAMREVTAHRHEQRAAMGR